MTRNYDNKPRKTPSTSELFECPLCSKKYKTEKKKQEHIEKVHYYATRNCNKFVFTPEIKVQIYELAHDYELFLRDIANRSLEEISLRSKNLLPQSHGKESPGDIERMNAGQRELSKKLFDTGLKYDLANVMIDLELFFRLGLPYYDTNFCPTLAMDFLWHSLMQDFVLYSQICKNSCGEIMPHCAVVRTEEEDQERHNYFLDVFQYKYGRAPCQPSLVAPIKSFLALREDELTIIMRKEEKVRQDKLDKERYQREMVEFAQKVGLDIKEILDCFGTRYQYRHFREGHEKFGYEGQKLRDYAAEILRQEFEARCDEVQRGRRSSC